jgi:hypothetical protein
MMGLTDLFAGLRSHWIPEQEVRAEAWALGGQYQGRVIEGARLQLKSANLPFRRAILLRAVIRSQARAQARVGAG